ncbi:trehalase family glycosidase [Allomuricauda sp. d1]|uniref:alpha-L-rhamnosidase-related protein n=1 Tax=Allomuricauda sp. d1 TaxID=3136725 RepID=UPI0031E3A1D5
MRPLYFSFLTLLFFGCAPETPKAFSELMNDAPSIKGKQTYLESPYVTAGNRVYMVGHQDGSFPDLGWHIKGEMGGIWNHPIKLMDGFEATIYVGDDKLSLNKATGFVNYPMANKHIFEFPEKGLTIERWQFVPDGKQGVFIQFLIKSISETDQNIDFEFTGHSDLRPTWLGERTNMVDGRDVASFDNGKWIVKDSNNEWYAVFGSDESPTKQEKKESEEENASSSSLTYSLDVGQTTAINFVISGSYQSENQALSEYADLQKNYSSYATDKKLRYASLAQQSKLSIPDKDLQQAFEWLKYNCDWLVRSVPEIGTGIGAGIPDYPWWFGVDSEYALMGYMAVGQTDPVYSTIKLLDSVSMALNGNGKIIHEMSTNGTVFNAGNINETPQFASLIWEIYKWNGDKEFLKKYFPTIEKGLNWLLLENDENKNLFPDGFGMMEIHGLDSEMIDVASYTQKAFSDAAKMADELGKTALANQYEALAENLKEKINAEFWSEEFNSYADFLGTDEQALHLIEDAIIRADTLNKPWAIEELEQTKKRLLASPSSELRPFVLHHNWVVNTPMEMGIADSAKAITALDTAKKFTNQFGVFVTGIDRDESAGKDDGSFQGSKVFSYTGAVMTLPTGVQAIAENNYGRPDEALDYLKRMARTFSYALPGSMYEVSPDYGMMTQAWNIYAFAIPIVQQFFGIQPMAHKKTVVIRPQMPSTWNEASLENVKVADNSISVFFSENDGKFNIKIHQINPEWTLKVMLPKDSYVIENDDVQITEEGANAVFISSGKELILNSK